MELSQQYEVHPNQIMDWKERLFENGVSVQGEDESKVKVLHAKIGELTMKRDFLSKALGRGSNFRLH